MMKKIISIMLLVLLLVCSVPMTFAEEAVAISNTDSEPAPQLIEDLIGAARSQTGDTWQSTEERIAFLQTLEPEMQVLADKTLITRADFLIMLVQFLSDSGSTGYTGFLDVDATNSVLMNSIGYAVGGNIISAGEYFRPYDSLTMAEMVKMGVSALGYDFLAQRNGGWPAGYYKTAVEIDLVKKVNDLSMKVTAEDAYGFLFSLLAVDRLEMIGLMPEPEYKIVKGSNLLESRYDVGVVEGLVSADGMTGLTATSAAVRDGYIQIGREVYKNSTGLDLLGLRVQAFYQETESNKELLFVKLLHEENIFVSDFSVAGFEVLTDVDGKEESYDLYRGYSLIINGSANPSADLSDYDNRDDVTLHLIDSDEDGLYEVVKVYVWSYMQIGTISQFTGKVTDKNVGGEVLTLDDEQLYQLYDCVDGKVLPLALSDLEVGDILTYLKCAEGSYIIFRSGLKAEGVLTQIDSTEHKIKLGDTFYPLSVYAQSKFANLNLGSTLTAYLDATGRVISIASTGLDYMYGWLVDTGEEGGLSIAGKVKIFTQRNEMAIYQSREKLLVDGVTKTWDEFRTMENNVEYSNRLVRFALDADGLLKSVDFSETSYSGSLPFTDEKNEHNNMTMYYSGTFTRRRSGNYDGKFQTNSALTISFSVPTEPNSGNEDYYLAQAIGSPRANASYTMQVYDIVKDGYPKAVVQIKDQTYSGHDQYTTAYSIVSVDKTLNSEGATCYAVTYFDGRAYKKYYSRPESLTKVLTLGVGDIVRFSVYDDEIYDLTIDYDCSAKSLISDIADHASYGYAEGYVYNVGTGTIQLLSVPSLANYTVRLADIVTMDFANQDLVMIDVYRNSDNSVKKVVTKYEPGSSLVSYLHGGTDASHIVYKMIEGGKGTVWVYREAQ